MHAVLWSDVDLENRKITVSKSYNGRLKIVKSTKASYWRSVPISDELWSVFKKLKAKAGNQEHVLPRFTEWTRGQQARILRKFCVGIGIRPIKFQALRACFATQVLRILPSDATIMGEVVSIFGLKAGAPA